MTAASAGCLGPEPEQPEITDAEVKQIADRLDLLGRYVVQHNQTDLEFLRQRAVEALGDKFLALQNAVQNESRRFQTLSNASKTRHDAAMAAIQNVR